VLKSGLTVIKSLCMSLSMYVYKNSQSEHLYEINQLFWLDHFLEYNYENYTPKYYHCQERSAFKFLVTDEVYSIQHHVINFVSVLQQIGVFLQVLPIPPPIKQSATV
jgi:hypothetical protein